jgi:hypothetical protein
MKLDYILHLKSKDRYINLLEWQVVNTAEADGGEQSASHSSRFISGTMGMSLDWP